MPCTQVLETLDALGADQSAYQLEAIAPDVSPKPWSKML